jgi:hypothetical protein
MAITGIERSGNINEISLHGIMRAKVLRTNDPLKEGRVWCLAPKMQLKYDHSAKKDIETKEKIQKPKFHDDSEVKADDMLTSTNGYWYRPAQFVYFGEEKDNKGGVYRVPRPGTWIFIFFEDGDPQKPYYFPFGPTNDGEVVTNKKSESTSLGSPEKKPNVDVIREYPNGTIIYTDFNSDRNEFIIKFNNDHVFRIADRGDKNGIEVFTHHNHYIRINDLDDTIKLSSSKGDFILIDEPAGEITIKARTHIQLKAPRIDLN